MCFYDTERMHMCFSAYTVNLFMKAYQLDMHCYKEDLNTEIKAVV